MTAPVDLGELDLSLAAMLAGLAMAEEVERRLAAAGFDDVRFSHGFVCAHLLREPLTVGALARAMGVTQQRASKAASELEALGYVRREADPADARVRRLVLAERGHGAVAAARAARGVYRAVRRGRPGCAPRAAPQIRSRAIAPFPSPLSEELAPDLLDRF